MSSEFHIEYMQPRHMAELGPIYGKAFQYDPAWTWAFKARTPAEFIEKNGWFWQRLLWCRLIEGPQHCFVVVHNKDGRIVGGIIEWPVVLQKKLGLWVQIKAGLLGVYWKLGSALLERILVMGRCEERQERLCEEKYGRGVLIRHVAIDPEFQGKGLGKAMLKFVVERAQSHGQPCILGTLSQKNVEFYSRLGFETTGSQRVIPEDSSSPTQWFMRRPLMSPTISGLKLELRDGSIGAPRFVGDIVPLWLVFVICATVAAVVRALV